MTTGIIWAQCVFIDVVLLSTAVVVTNSNLPYKQWLTGMVVMLGGCCG